MNTARKIGEVLGRAAVFAGMLCLVLTAGCKEEKEKLSLDGLPKDLRKIGERLRDKDNNVRQEACIDLGHMGSSAVPAVPYLAEALHDSVINVRLFAAMALGDIGPEAKAAIPDLEWSVTHNEWKEVREAAQKALVRIRGE